MTNRQTSSTLTPVTRAAAGEGRTVYDNFSIALRWTTVLLALAQFGLAQTRGWFARPVRHMMVVAHTAFGMILAAVIVIRIVWHLVPGHQMPAAVSGWTELASKVMRYLLYAMVGAEAVLCFVLRWSGN